ncbi:hypothetical protein N9W89_08505 [Hellea sp.]|nr:hypothetical protein [Hellea sp.]
MKTRILPIIGLTFAILLLSRTVAVSSEVNPNQPIMAIEPKTGDSPPELVESPALQCLTGAVLETVSADMKRLDLRKKEMSERESALKAIEAKLATQMSAIEKANAALHNNIESLKGLADDDLKHLVGMYQTMKPKQAAEIFNSMDPSFAAGFLREMNSDKAGLIMANMNTRKSYAVSVIIAGRNAKYRQSKS